MEHVNTSLYREYKEEPIPYIVTFEDEKNRSKLISFLDRVGSYTGYDKDMLLRVFVSTDNDFCAMEAIDYNLTFVNTSHKLIDFLTDCKVIDNMPISLFRSLIGRYQ